MLHGPNSAAHFQLTGIVILLSANRLARSNRQDAAAVCGWDRLADHRSETLLARVSAQGEWLGPIRVLQLYCIGGDGRAEVEVGLLLSAPLKLDVIAHDLVLLQELRQRRRMARERLGVVAAVVAAHTEQPSDATCVGWHFESSDCFDLLGVGVNTILVQDVTHEGHLRQVES